MKVKATVTNIVTIVTEDEMDGMKWLDQKKNSRTIDTYLWTLMNIQSMFNSRN